jgi:hypothetical protein
LVVAAGVRLGWRIGWWGLAIEVFGGGGSWRLWRDAEVAGGGFVGDRGMKRRLGVGIWSRAGR